MIKSAGRGLTASGIIMAIVLSAGAPAWAEPAKPATVTVELPRGAHIGVPKREQIVMPVLAPNPESEKLARHLVNFAFEDIESFKPMFDLGMTFVDAEMQKQGAAAEPDSIESLALRRFGNWPHLAADAVWEEFLQDRPALTELVGHYMAERFTPEELRAAVALCDGPWGKEAKTVLMAKAISKGKTGSFGPAANKAMEAFKASAAGQSFMKKAAMISKDKGLEPLSVDLVAQFLPGAMRRFGEKAEAAEAARKTAAVH